MTGNLVDLMEIFGIMILIGLEGLVGTQAVPRMGYRT